METERVGIRELKQNLSRYLRRVKSGGRIVVTERNKPFAVILPGSGETEQERLLRLLRSGTAHWSGGRPQGLNPRVQCKGSPVSEAVLEDRG